MFLPDVPGALRRLHSFLKPDSRLTANVWCDKSNLQFATAASAIATDLDLPPPPSGLLGVFARSVEQGRVAGRVSVSGIHAATLIHVAAAALGLSAVLASSVLVFSVVKYAGAAYLVWLGLKRLLDPSEATAVGNAQVNSLAHLFRDGFIVNLYAPTASTAGGWLKRNPAYFKAERWVSGVIFIG